jgi:hypothetical protein
MIFHFRYRTAALAALAISLVMFAGFPALAGATGKSDTANGGKASAPGQAKKAPETTASTTEPSSGTPTAADHPEGFSTHDATNGPGGQVCDGDPNNAPGAGGNYENTCPAGPSQNGAGDGKATGKPCAGCVGNADDKNPKGQADSGPSDHNNGYECDQKGRSANEGNNGVGFGNPAHSGCTSTPSVTPTCPDGSPMPASNDVNDCSHKPPTCPNGSPMPASGDVKDCSHKPPTCPNGAPMPTSGDVKDCSPKPPTCPNGAAMPASGNVSDCSHTATCVDGSALPAVGTGTCPEPCPAGSVMPAGGEKAKDCLPTCPDGSVMPASGNAADCVTGGAVLGETLARPTEVLGVQLERTASGPLAFTGGAHLGGLLQLAGVLGLLGGGLTTVGRRRRDHDGDVDLEERLAGHC